MFATGIFLCFHAKFTPHWTAALAVALGLTVYHLILWIPAREHNLLTYAAVVDKMSVTNTSGTFQGSFDTSSSLMYSVYGRAQQNTAVPSGWLIPFTYINVGRPVKATDETAKVRLIVPHKQGHLYATRGVYPCLYTLTFERGR